MKKEIKRFKDAFRGIGTAFISEAHIRFHFLAVILVTIAGFLLKISLLEWFMCLICFGLVISAEMTNTAIEKTVDLVTKEKNELARIAKDVAAGAVLVNAIISAIIGLIIFTPKIIILFANI